MNEEVAEKARMILQPVDAPFGFKNELANCASMAGTRVLANTSGCSDEFQPGLIWALVKGPLGDIEGYWDHSTGSVKLGSDLAGWPF